uniref:Uncharacterized protein n=1 Tax=Meloidogyne enterolobii TaxID=390850 RepID=A0A6V7UM07_MELEN|nr:unnamed protein product [Meloidogyne enterolobii]
MPNETISSLVNIYSSGRSDEKSKDSIEAPTSKTLIKISETTKQPELELKPLEIEKKHIGYYEHLTTKALSETLEIPQPSIVQQTNPEVSSFETYKSTELNKSQIDQFINVYSSGRSDEIREVSKSETPIKITKTTKNQK